MPTDGHSSHTLNKTGSAYGTGLVHARRSWAALLASAGLLLLLGTLAAAIVLAREQAGSQIRSSFQLRGASSASFAANYLSEQAGREQHAADRFLAARHVSAADFRLVAATLNSASAVLLDSSGRVLEAFPSAPALRGQALAAGYPDMTAAERGRVAVAGIISSPVTGGSVTAVSLPYPSAGGRRVLSADYTASGLALDALVDHTISYPEHQVFIVDSSERLVAASPATQAVTLAQADPELARAVASRSHGSVPGSATATTFTTAPVPGTSWRLLIAVPDKRLYASIAGWTLLVPWLVFALVTLLGVLLVALFARSLSDRARLTKLSAAMRRTAQTDSLTGLHNRRALTEQLTRASAHARRHDEPLSVLMIDLDRFKQTNDSFGHEAGDQVLCTLADCMRDVLRIDDIYGRWGGDEFLVALPVTDEAGARVSAGRLRQAAGAVDLATIGLPGGVALSIGVATGVHTSPLELIRQADLALYRAKAAGHEGDLLAQR
jgi:diguanylate cyclase (GGDEF)-like protein